MVVEARSRSVCQRERPRNSACFPRQKWRAIATFSSRLCSCYILYYTGEKAVEARQGIHRPPPVVVTHTHTPLWHREAEMGRGFTYVSILSLFVCIHKYIFSLVGNLTLYGR